MLSFSISKKLIFYLVIISTQISTILSDLEKCYSIKNCETCPELDFCEKCKPGFTFNNPKTKCNIKGTSQNIKNINVNNNMNKNSNINIINNTKPSMSNQVQNKVNENQQKPPVDPFQNIPFASIQKMKQNDINRAKINKLLICILIILVLSIILSTAYDLLKKIFNRGEDDDIQEESSKVVIH